MINIEYSVIIRTIGKAGEKYQELLNSIQKLEPQPREIIVVLPKGYAEPEEKLGCETFYYSPKGMVKQRLYGINMCKTEYALVLDDDIAFESDFVLKLYEPIKNGLGAISSGPLYSLLPEKGVKAVFSAVCAGASPTLFHKDRYISILKTAGYSYNRNLTQKHKFYETQSLPWACFFAEVSALKDIMLEDEVWLDANGYAGCDDQTMFYKAWLRGIKTIVVADATYIHNDAQTASRNIKPVVLYCLSLNRMIFWHRFIYKMQKGYIAKIWAKVCFGYRLSCDFGIALVYYLLKRYSKNELQTIIKAFGDAKEYIKSQEYNSLPPVL